MTEPLTIALDAMGGDNAPRIVVKGAALARIRHPNVRFLLFGDEMKIQPLLKRKPKLRKIVSLIHTDKVVPSDMKPSLALRQGRGSSMWEAINAVSDGKAGAAVSAGNTGALMAMAKLSLGTLPGIDRPAIAAFFPTMRGESVMLDLGANVECDANNLVQFAVMGEVFARTVLGTQQPTIGLLNVGEEPVKGRDAVKTASTILRNTRLPIKFEGFVEGDDIAAGTVDVIVTDGFTGNIALKTAEGTARLLREFVRQAFKSSFIAKIGFFLARSALRKMQVRTDPRRYNGAMFLGLNGIAVKSHGGTDALGFANAIGVAIDLAAGGFNDRIKEEFGRLSETADTKPQAAAS
ncbi:MAG TPA: phosphate acyltransferase PlsX [Alphaproteobacteria bacterium]|nr:phosphate acyltransferase PlsX [Alphaproteobacteria bacterium]